MYSVIHTVYNAMVHQLRIANNGSWMLSLIYNPTNAYREHITMQVHINVNNVDLDVIVVNHCIVVISVVMDSFNQDIYVIVIVVIIRQIIHV